ncbi:MAG: efflux RND transporter periplasmic adaptor subunit [Amphritea sp.]|nr:efflux RND transporter periplasmic adaptor subunit [Amphritea sp.]
MKYFVAALCTCFCAYLSAATSVVVHPLHELLVKTPMSAPAQVINEDHAQISAQLSARVTEILVRVGDQVTADQPLVMLDCRDYDLAAQRAQSSLGSLQAQIRLARQQLNRAERLVKQNSASKELRDQRRAELDSLQAQSAGARAGISEAELAQSRCSVTAPFAGVVTERSVSQGNLVTPGTPLLKLLGSDQSEVSAALTAQQAASLQQAQAIHYQYFNRQYPLQFRALVPYADQRSRTQQIRLSFTEESAIAGSSGRLVWQEAGGRLPVRYIVSREGKLGVMLYRDGTAEFMMLPDAIEGQAAKVDLPADTLVIVEGHYGAVSGEPVTVQDDPS